MVGIGMTLNPTPVAAGQHANLRRCLLVGKCGAGVGRSRDQCRINVLKFKFERASLAIDLGETLPPLGVIRCNNCAQFVAFAAEFGCAISGFGGAYR